MNALERIDLLERKVEALIEKVNRLVDCENSRRDLDLLDYVEWPKKRRRRDR